MLLCVSVGLVTLMYVGMGLAASKGTLIMPLDDTYIHFQYAKQMAHGEPLVYNPGDDATSGSTSLIYTPLLAVGYLVGLHGLRLAYWAVGIGALALLITAWLVYKLVMAVPAQNQRLQRLIAVISMLAVVANGPLAWAAFSGMETLLFTMSVMLALDAFVRWTSNTGAIRELPLRNVMSTAAFVALVRPEGLFVALPLVAVIAWETWRKKERISAWFALPVAAVVAQPAINWLVTGSPSASGTQVKSHFYNETIPFIERIQTVLEFWWRMWREWIVGRSPVSGWYVPPLISVLAVMMVIAALVISWKRRAIQPALMAGGWMILLTAADATLDTGFWQFKRYQMPVLAILFPLAGWALVMLGDQKPTWARPTALGLAVLVGVLSLPLVPDYAGRYYENIVVTRDQQVAMAMWVKNHVPEEARVAVHDV
ncbi:MAG TPA: hypothetical protein VHP83_08325, partial [Aggregatilineaceae bacterium]|nr:hypothetical protein [Aggregatilineaceae bacterium]